MASFVAGWDGGGTKTKVVCLAEDGTVLSEASFGALNPNGAQKSEVQTTVAQAMTWMNGIGECVALALSVAGVSNPETADLLCRLIAENGYHGPLRLVGDQESALYGAVGDVGAVLVAGTGSICYGRNAAGETARSGGYGYLVDDEGSGYAIGRDILIAVLRAGDGRMPSTCLTELLAAREGWGNASAIMKSLYGGSFEKAKVASLAPLVLEAAGDAAASTIIDKVSVELTLMATAVIDKLHLESARLAFSGSILTHITPIRSRVEGELVRRYPLLQGFDPIADAAHGAARMALQLIGKECEPNA